MCVYLFITLVSCFVYFWCAGSVRISLAGRVIYFLCGCLRCVECRAGTILSVHFLGADGGIVQIFPFLWLCCSGYGTVEMVRGGGPCFFFFLFYFLQFAVSFLGGRMPVVGLSFL